MKNYILILIAVALFLGSCKESAKQSNQSSLVVESFEIDTIMIDSKGYFFYLAEALGKSFLSHETGVLYNLNQKKPQLELVDLNALTLLDSIPLEREGPIGIGNYPIYDKFQLTKNGEILIFAWEELVKLTSDRTQVVKYRFDQLPLVGDTLLANEVVRYRGLVTEDGKYYIGYYGNANDTHSRLGLVKINLEDLTVKKINLPLFQELVPYEIKTKTTSEYPYTYVEGIFLAQVGDQLLVSSTPVNEVYRVDIESGKYERISYSSNLTANKVEINYPTVNTQSEGVYERWKQVSFYKWEWDETSQLFWRITNQTFVDSEIQPNKVHLTFFDKNLNQVGEIKLPDDWKIMGAPFFFQGMYWQFINIDDEMAFVRFKPRFD
ncbi:MAG: DUF4221 domain-containing protein [Cytophagales bacterium]|nr:MAG: DUF4221 domain-containing protein [Cytophagales bacterium]